MSIVRSWTLAVVALSQLPLLPAFAAQQLVTTKTLLVKNPPSGARKVLWKVKETAATVAGDPTADGATLHIQLTPGGDQCVTMPASGWTAIGTIGFKYKDATLANGPVKVAQIKKTPSGTFIVKVLLKNGGPASIAVTPGNQTTSYATNFTLGVGDEYCGGTATATPNPNDANTFKVSNDGAPSGCIASCNATTTSTSVTTTFTGTITTTSTTLSLCGNGVREPGEQCDDGNTANLDGCDGTCLFEQNQRLTSLALATGTTATCTANALGGTFSSGVTLTQVNNALAAGVADGSLSILLRMLGLEDLTGTTDAAVQVGVLRGSPVAGAGYDGTNDVDWWYTADILSIDANRVPLAQLAGTVAAKVLVAGPGSATIDLTFGGSLVSAFMSSLKLTSTNGAVSTPAVSAGGPPGHLVSEQLDPTLQSYQTSGAGTLCGNVSAASLASSPIPPGLTGTACSQNYTAVNSLLDVIVGGCNFLIIQVVQPTQPDAVDPGVPAVGAGGPYTLTANASKVVSTCRDQNSTIVDLNGCLAAAAYSARFQFTSDRVIIK